MPYCDTSLLVASLTEEHHTSVAGEWLVAQAAGTLRTSAWTHTEIASALSLKVRTGDLDPDRKRRTWQSWQTIAQLSFTILPVEPRDFLLAASFLDKHEHGLRAGDALHLAIVSRTGDSLATLDHRMAAAALRFDIAVDAIVH